MEEGTCWGNLRLEDHEISWKLRWKSDFGVTLSDKGWIGFSRSPHSDATFSGEITLDGRKFAGEPLGFGVQGHNCGYRHRTFWRWMHAYFPNPAGTMCARFWLGVRTHRTRRFEEEAAQPDCMEVRGSRFGGAGQRPNSSRSLLV